MKQKFKEEPSRIVVSVGSQVTYVVLNYNIHQTDNDEWESDCIQFKTTNTLTLSEIVDAIIQSGDLCSIQELENIKAVIVETFNTEISEEELFNVANPMLLALNSAYGSSEAVNVFHYDGNNLWIDKETRAGILARISAEEESGKDGSADLSGW